MPDRYDELTMLAYIEGDLAPQQEQAFEQHLREDARLRQLVDLLMADRERLRQLPLEQAPPEIMERVSLTLERQMLLGEASRGPGLARRVQTMRYTRYLAISAVAALVLISTGLMLTTIFQSAQLQKQVADSQYKERLAVLQPQEKQADRALEGSAAVPTAVAKPKGAANEIAPLDTAPMPAVALGPLAAKDAAALPTDKGQPTEGTGATLLASRESRSAAPKPASAPDSAVMPPASAGGSTGGHLAAVAPATAVPADVEAPARALEHAGKAMQAAATAEPNLPEQLAMKVMRQKEEITPQPMPLPTPLNKEQQVVSTADVVAPGGDLELRVTTSHSTVTQQFLLAWAKNHRAVVLEPQKPATLMLKREAKLALEQALGRDASLEDIQRKDADLSAQQSSVGANREEMIAGKDLGDAAADKRASEARVSAAATPPGAPAAAPAAPAAAPAAPAPAPAAGAKAIAAESTQATPSERLALSEMPRPAANGSRSNSPAAALPATTRDQAEPEVAAAKKADALQQRDASVAPPAVQAQMVMHLTREQLEQLLAELRELPGLVVHAPAVVPEAHARARGNFRVAAADAHTQAASSTVLAEVSQIELLPPMPQDESDTLVPRRPGRAVRIILVQPTASPEPARPAP